MQPTTVVVTAVSGQVRASPWLVMDRYADPGPIGFGAVVVGTATYSVQHTFWNVGLVGTAGAVAFAHASVASAVANQSGSYDFPVAAIRLVVSAGDSPSTVALTVIQAGS